MPLTQLLIAAGVALLVVQLSPAALFRLGGLPVRLAAVALALGAGLVLDDPAAETLAATPTTLAARRALRLLLAVPVLGAAWILVLGLSAQRLPMPAAAATDPSGAMPAGGVTTAVVGTGEMPAGGFTLELAGMVAAALAVAALAIRVLGDGRVGGVVAGPALLALLGAALRLPGRWALFAPHPAHPVWAGAQGRWLLALLVATTVLTAASRDPAARLRPRRANQRGSKPEAPCW